MRGCWGGGEFVLPCDGKSGAEEVTLDCVHGDLLFIRTEKFGSISLGRPAKKGGGDERIMDLTHANCAAEYT